MDEHPRAGFLRADDFEDLSEIFSEIKILGNKEEWILRYPEEPAQNGMQYLM
jgi:hypothetical protein